jgi:SM-20-related protein
VVSLPQLTDATADVDAWIAAQIESVGACVVDGFVAPPLCAELRARLADLRGLGRLRPARVGRAAGARADAQIRGDHIAWLESEHMAERELLGRCDTLRVALNRSLYLGLESFEAHFAFYKPGDAYQRHLDRHSDNDARVVSLILYLVKQWPASAGGELRLFGIDRGHADVAPREGRAVVFLSERFEHEVLPARDERLSIAGWFRRRELGY